MEWVRQKKERKSTQIVQLQSVAGVARFDGYTADFCQKING